MWLHPKSSFMSNSWASPNLKAKTVRLLKNIGFFLSFFNRNGYQTRFEKNWITLCNFQPKRKKIIEYKICSKTKRPLLRCFPCFSKLKAVDLKFFLESKRTTRLFLTDNLDHRQNCVFIVSTLTVERRVIKSNLCICWYHSAGFDV